MKDTIEMISELVQKMTGVQLGAKNRTMVRSRLQKRILELGVGDENGYWEYFQKHQEEEKALLVSLLTTHYTFFFREFAHFEFLQKELPALAQKARDRGDKKIRIWSAACSRGQEVYSLAMFLLVHLKQVAPDVTFEIEGTDVDPQSVEIAKNGVYLREELKNVPLIYQEKVWARGTGDIASYVKASKELRDRVKFRPVNLFDQDPSFKSKWDLIFCRNVFIYFNPDQIKDVSQKFLKCLDQDGFLFIGISESLNGLKLPCDMHGPSIYSHPKTAPQTAPAARPVPVRAPAAEAKPLRVFCIDDSSSIHVLLKKMFTPANGFEVVGTAMNGKEALQKIPVGGVDVITLDIHMPEMTGLELLKAWKGRPPAPVVVVSSVSREQADLALQMLENGASDYVEKPELARFEDCRDEILAKLRTVWYAGKTKHRSNLDLDRSFAKKVSDVPVEKTARVAFFSWPDADRVTSWLREAASSASPILLRIDGDETLMKKFQDKIKTVPSLKLSDGFEVAPGKILLFGRQEDPASLLARAGERHLSVAVFGRPGPKINKALKSAKAHVMLEDFGAPEKSPDGFEVVPVTSFAAMSDDYFMKKAA